MNKAPIIVIEKSAGTENVKNSEGVESLVDIAETVLDDLLSDEVVKEIPVLKTLISIGKLGSGIRDRIFQGKIFKFIKSVKEHAGEKLLFAADIRNDEKIQKKSGEHLCLILEKLDDLEKIPMLAKAFVAFLRNKISFTDYRRVAAAIERCFVPDTVHLNSKGVDEYLSDRKVIDTLSNAGFIEISSIPQVKGPDAKNKYTISEIGQIFLDFVIN